MPYYVLEDFRRGLDVRRLASTSAAGSLQRARNLFVNSGGELEKVQAWIEVPELSAVLQPLQPGRGGAGVYGPIALPDGSFAYVGKGAEPAAFPDTVGDGIPLRWGRLPDASSTLLDVASHNVFGTNLYVVGWHDPAENGGVPAGHYYGDPASATEFATVSPPFAGNVSLTHQQKVWTAAGNLLSASAIDDPTDWAGTGSLTIDLSKTAGTVGKAIGLGEYFGQLAIFGASGAQLWTMDPNPNLSRRTQTLGGVELLAHKSLTQYSNGDLILLGRSGIRSLQARDSSNFARVDDVGSPIDRIVRDKLATLPGVVTRSPSVVEPQTGQLWMGLHDTIYVLSRFSSADVLAWTQTDVPPGEDLFSGDMAATEGQVLLTTNSGRSFLLGGECGDEYDHTLAEAVTPFLSMDDPGTTKIFQGLDVACKGTWQIDVAVDPGQPDRWVKVATVEAPTYRHLNVPLYVTAQHVAVRMRCNSPERAVLGQVALHYESGDRG